jgi:hypothetical protein
MIMKYVVMLVAMAASASAAEIQFVPLQDYIGQAGIEKDPAALGYIAERCSALYGVWAKNLVEETDPERRKLMLESYGAFEKFKAMAARQMMVGTTIELKDAIARTSNMVIKLSEFYADRIEAARLRSNNMFSDPLITGDVATCKGLLQKLL